LQEPNECYQDGDKLTLIKRNAQNWQLFLNNPIEPYDDECLLYDKKYYDGDILSIEMGNRRSLNVDDEDFSKLFERVGSIKCGKDIQRLITNDYRIEGLSF